MLQQLQDIRGLIFMNRIEATLKGKKSFIGFLTAGDPNLDKTEEYILTMAKAGCDLIEVGIPFSDPIAEGKVIEMANMRALSAGTTLEKVFAMIANVRTKTDVPIAFLTYLNPMFNYGYERFFARAKQTNIDGIIIPDMPYEEQGEILNIAKKNSVDIISLIAPTSEKRVTEIAKNAQGFIYLVSSLGVTGVRSEITTDLKTITQSIKSVTDVPICVGFGISSAKQARSIWEYADGVIVGSAIVKIIETYGENAEKPLFDYITEIKNCV